ncbi:MAG: hypothetical protein GQ532_10810 [Methylomarinum sp.]|nr:hypothetical protein [Methylomarinum sp.]
MEALYPLLIVIAIGILLLIIAHWSRKSFEKTHGKITFKEQCQTLVIFLIWVLCLSLWMFQWPISFGWFYSVMLLLNFPLIKTNPDRSLAWRIQETAFLAMIVMAPFVLLYHGYELTTG